MKTVVIKVGGSLFDLPDLVARLSQFLDQLESSHPLIICGGGATANLIRSWSDTYLLSEETAHWLAIQAMVLNEKLLSELLPDTCIVISRAEAITAWNENRIPILCSYTYLQQLATPQIPALPASWKVTSDSIAAWVSLTWPAEELILLKSVDFPLEMTLTELSQAGFVDAYFPTFSDELPQLSWNNLRSNQKLTQLTTVTSGKSFHIRNATGPA